MSLRVKINRMKILLKRMKKQHEMRKKKTYTEELVPLLVEIKLDISSIISDLHGVKWSVDNNLMKLPQVKQMKEVISVIEKFDFNKI